VNTHLNTGYWVDKAEDYVDPPPTPPSPPSCEEYSMEDTTVKTQQMVLIYLFFICELMYSQITCFAGFNKCE